VRLMSSFFGSVAMADTLYASSSSHSRVKPGVGRSNAVATLVKSHSAQKIRNALETSHQRYNVVSSFGLAGLVFPLIAMDCVGVQ
jgi:hypothetical protein